MPSTPPHLPRLGVDNGGHSASLRGNYHSKVPEIANQPLNTLLPILKDGTLHPEPYYITQNVEYAYVFPWELFNSIFSGDTKYIYIQVIGILGLLLLSQPDVTSIFISRKFKIC